MQMFERDPEEIGPEHPEDLDLRMRTMESLHEFVSGPNGRCDETLFRRDGSEYRCNLDSWSVLHTQIEYERHDHGGYDCMCFEFDGEDY